MFDMKEFLMDGLRDAVGKQGDYWVVDKGEAWMSKGYLNEENLAEIHSLIKAKNTPEDIQDDEIGEDIPEEETEETAEVTEETEATIETEETEEIIEEA